MASWPRTGIALLGPMMLGLISVAAPPKYSARRSRAAFCIPSDRTYLYSPGDCIGDGDAYELQYEDACCIYDTGEEADEDLVCTDPHESCVQPSCTVVSGKTYHPPKPVMQVDDYDQWVYWEEYEEDYVGENQCTNSCVNGWTDDVISVMWGESDTYGYLCYC